LEAGAASATPETTMAVVMKEVILLNIFALGG
jgi:hypothetical protein